MFSPVPPGRTSGGYQERGRAKGNILKLPCGNNPMEAFSRSWPASISPSGRKGVYMDKTFEKEEKELLLEIQKFYWEYLQEYMAREDADISTVNMGIGLLRGLIYISTKFHSDRSVGPSIIPSSLSQGM